MGGGIQIDYIIDATYQTAPFADIEVLKPEALRDMVNANILVCAANSFRGIVNYLETIGCTHIFNISGLLEEFRGGCQISEFRSSYLYGDLDIDELIGRYNFFAGLDDSYAQRVYLSYCVLPVTNKCSLNCKKCAAFIPSYLEHDDYTIEYVQSVMSRFLDCIDGIGELEIMGGEPLLCAGFDRILEWCTAQPKIHAIKIVTNATIIPKQKTIGLLKHNKVKLVLDDYKEKSTKLDELVQLAVQNNIRYYVQRLNTWFDVEWTENQGQSQEQLKRNFSNCIMRNCIGITNGRLYHCNVAGHMHNLKRIPDLKDDYINLLDNPLDWKELRSVIKEFINKEWLESCNYCTLWKKIKIPVAEQEEREEG